MPFSGSGKFIAVKIRFSDNKIIRIDERDSRRHIAQVQHTVIQALQF